MKMVTSNADKLAFLQQVFQRHPWMQHPEFFEHQGAIIPEMVLKKVECCGVECGLMFIGYSGLNMIKESTVFRGGQKTNAARFLKSSLFEWESKDIVSLGLPLIPPADKEARLEWIKNDPDPEYREKFDGVCLLATKYRDGYVVKSRRAIYHQGGPEGIYKYATNDYPLGERLHALLDGEWDNIGPFTLACECVFPHPFFAKCEAEQFASILGHSMHFTPYVRYTREDAFLTSIMLHDGSLLPQAKLDELAVKYQIKRPKRVLFSDTDKAMEWLKRTTNSEGFMVYIDNGQTPLKFKTSWYKQVMRVSGSLFRAVRSSKKPGEIADSEDPANKVDEVTKFVDTSIPSAPDL